MPVTPKSFGYAIDVDRDGRVGVERGAPEDVPSAWKPEHFLLAGLVRCTFTSLRYHAGRAEIEQLVARGSASGTVAKRDSDERFAFVELECRLEVELESVPPRAELAELLAKAERDCFVGASLTAPPRYRWTVNGEAVSRD